jgi:hypothetical protein
MKREHVLGWLVVAVAAIIVYQVVAGGKGSGWLPNRQALFGQGPLPGSGPGPAANPQGAAYP